MRILTPTAETSTAMSIRLSRVDNLATRKVALLLCNHTYKNDVKDIDGYSVGKVFEARHKTSLMDRFLLQVLGFDSVKTHVDLDKEGLDEVISQLRAVEIEPWLTNGKRKGTLLIFVYFMGFWGTTSGSTIYSVKGEIINLDQRLIQLSAIDKSIYTVQWVECGLERDIPALVAGDNDFECERSVYQEGAKRWFTLFYNSATNKFIDYFERLIKTEKRVSLRFPEDI